MAKSLRFLFKNRRAIIGSALLIALASLLLIVLLRQAPDVSAWKPYDYGLYISWGRSLRAGVPTYSYPLPTIFWLFVPLSLLPDWFVVIWAAVPFLFILLIFGRKGLPFWLFFPLLVQAEFAQLDGWLIFPMLWLVQDRRVLAPLGAVFLLFKPTLAPLAIFYAIYRWLTIRAWRKLALLATFLFVYELPAFILDPWWANRFVNGMSVRASESNMTQRGASIWAWLWHGGVTAWLFPPLALLVLVLTIYVARHTKSLTPTAELLNLIGLPFLYFSNFTLVIPLATTFTEILVLTIVSWLSVAIDYYSGGWGGAYTIIPIFALAFRARRVGSDSYSRESPYPAPHYKLRA
jgi:hypothetical protein